MDTWVNEVADMYRGKISSASNNLKESVKPYTEQTNSGIVGGLTLADYWYYVDNGRRPGSKFPPVNSIRKWIEQKNIIPRSMQLPSGRNIIPTKDQLAYLIGRSISKNGIEGKHYLRDSIDSLYPKLKERLSEELTNIVVLTIKSELNVL